MLYAICYIRLYAVHIHTVAAGLPPTEWCKEIVYMIPKEAGVDVIEKQRTKTAEAAGVAKEGNGRYSERPDGSGMGATWSV
jgi:hypothetical protein